MADTRWIGALLLRAAVATTLVAGTALLARVPLSPVQGEANSGIRLAWKTEQARIRHCRQPTEQELARLPLHMRQREICDELHLDYELRLELDGAPLEKRTVRPAGIRRTRPLAVERTFYLPAGRHELTLRFFPRWEGELPAEIASSPEFLALPRIELERVPVELQPGRILLVTLDAEGRVRLFQAAPDAFL